jgi:Tfp pilus assembly protein PilP
MTRVLAIVMAGLLAAAVSLSAQEPQPPPGLETPGETPGEPERPPLDAELEPPGGFTYNPQGRRDPFVSLRRPVAADQGVRTRKQGMEGFMIQEVALRGIVRTQGGGSGVAAQAGFIAIFQDPTGKSYFVRTGQRLYDGVITAVDATSVSFRQEVTDPLSPVKTREVKKSLYASEEARQ